MGLGIAVLHRPAVGETICGDVSLIRRAATTTTIALADGLGHGASAAEAAVVFCEYVRCHETEDLTSLLDGAHRALARTRGAAAAILRVEEEAKRLLFAGVGNITLACAGDDRIRPFSVAGVLGKRIGKVRVFEYVLERPVLLALASDGVSSHLDLADYTHLEVSDVAAAIVERHGKKHDDTSCVVLRSRGAEIESRATVDRAAGSPSVLDVCHPSDSVWTSLQAARFARAQGFASRQAWEIGIAVSELVSNAVKHAGGGTATFQMISEPRTGFEVLVVDSGPGVPNPNAAMEDGYSGGHRLTLDERIRHAGGLGFGLGAVKRLMDELDLQNRAEGGLAIRARKWLS